MPNTNIAAITGIISHDDAVAFRGTLLAWYDRHRRVLPWRALPDETPNPYHVWLSEIMLQQTTVKAVIPYFLKFTETWPDVHALANADNDDVMSAWAGLGYYARARNLHKCAKIVSQEYEGVFPKTVDELRKLAGVGDYTSAAIASIAYGQPANVVDGNVERVMARYHACDAVLPAEKAVLKSYAAAYADGFTARTGDYAQALMDLGATICTPKSPSCVLCPVRDSCAGLKRGDAEMLPRKAPKKKVPKRYGYLYYIENSGGDILLHKRPDKGLLGGTQAFPTSEWGDNKSLMQHLDMFQGLDVESLGVIEHVFTHFHLTLHLIRIHMHDYTLDNLPKGYMWQERAYFDKLNMPSVFQKARQYFEV